MFRDEIPKKREPIGPAGRLECSFWSVEVHSHATSAAGLTWKHVVRVTTSQPVYTRSQAEGRTERGLPFNVSLFSSVFTMPRFPSNCAKLHVQAFHRICKKMETIIFFRYCLHTGVTNNSGAAICILHFHSLICFGTMIIAYVRKPFAWIQYFVCKTFVEAQICICTHTHTHVQTYGAV